MQDVAAKISDSLNAGQVLMTSVADLLHALCCCVWDFGQMLMKMVPTVTGTALGPGTLHPGCFISLCNR